MGARARITSLGYYLPERVLTNADLEEMVETNDEWITDRTGIKERRIAGQGETTSHMGIAAARRAIDAATIDPAEIDLVLFATFTPDCILANTASLVAHGIGAVNAGAMDLGAACTGHVYGLATAKAFIESGVYRHVLVVSADKVSHHIDYTDRRTCILFGDGATAAVVSAEGAGYEIETIYLGCDGARSNLLCVPGGGTAEGTSAQTLENGRHFVHMQGSEVFKFAVRSMVGAAQKSLDELGLTVDDIRWLVPHQANTRIIEATAKRCHMPMDCVYMESVRRFGNTSAPSIGVAMQQLLEEQPIQLGERILLVAFGAGFTWGSAIVKKIDESES